MQHLKTFETMLLTEIVQIMLRTVFCKFVVNERHIIAVQARTGAEVPDVWGIQICRKSAHEGDKIVSPTYRPSLPKEIPLVLISVRSGVESRAIVRPEGLNR